MPGAETLREGGAGRAGSHGPSRARAAIGMGALLFFAGATVLVSVGTGVWALVCCVPAAASCTCWIAATFLARRFVVIRVDGESMEPTYRHGDRVLVRRGAAFRRDQVVVIERPAVPALAQTRRRLTRTGQVALPARHWLIKRVAAMPGDPVPFLGTSMESGPGDRPPGRRDALVPDGRLVLLGDNSDHSVDSRHVGYFPTHLVLGPVCAVLSAGGQQAGDPSK